MASFLEFDRVLRAAINDVTEHGYIDEEQMKRWMRLLREAAQRTLMPEETMRSRMSSFLRSIYNRLVEQGRALTQHVGVERFTIENLKPKLREELQRRIFSSAELIKLNRDEEIEKTLRRFAGWMVSVGRGGTKTTDKRQQASDIRKSLAGLSFRERRVLIDQGQKLTSAINDIIATDGGAIAAHWISYWKQVNYDYREDHKDRMQESAKLPYVVRDNWALQKGLMKLGGSKYTDEMTQPGEEPFCQCYYRYVYRLEDLPVEMLTRRGREAISEARMANR